VVKQCMREGVLEGEEAGKLLAGRVCRVEDCFGCFEDGARSTDEEVEGGEGRVVRVKFVVLGLLLHYIYIRSEGFLPRLLVPFLAELVPRLALALTGRVSFEAQLPRAAVNLPTPPLPFALVFGSPSPSCLVRRGLSFGVQRQDRACERGGGGNRVAQRVSGTLVHAEVRGM
jgi:hypothetical protein